MAGRTFPGSGKRAAARSAAGIHFFFTMPSST